MRPVKIMWPKAYCSCLTSLPSCHTARQCTVTNCLNIWIFLQKLISFYHTDRCDFKCFHKCDTYLLAVVMLCSIRDWWWWWGGGRRKTATEDLVFEYALNSELASSQRGACTHNVVVRCMVGILIDLWKMSWMLSAWMATALLALCRGQNIVNEGRPPHTIIMKLNMYGLVAWMLCLLSFALLF